MNHNKFYTCEFANAPVMSQLQLSATTLDSRGSISSSKHIACLPVVSVLNRQSSSSVLPVSESVSTRENGLFSKVNRFRKSLVESKENINKREEENKFENKERNKYDDVIFRLSERVLKLEEKNECFYEEKMKEMSDVVTKIVEEKIGCLDSKICENFDKKIELINLEISQCKQRLSLSLPVCSEVETLRLCKSMIDDKMIGEKIERIKSIREESERLHDKFNFRDKIWNEKLVFEHKFVEESLQELRNSLGEFGKMFGHCGKEGNHNVKKDCKEGEVNKGMFSLQEFANRLELIEDKVLKSIKPVSEQEKLKADSISQILAFVHIEIALKSLNNSQLTSLSPESESIPFTFQYDTPCAAVEASYTYKIDSDGCIVDEEGYYLLDKSNNVIKLEREQIERLFENGLMKKRIMREGI